MKIETLVFDNLKKMIPADASKTILFAGVADTNYELFFYCIERRSGFAFARPVFF